MAGWRGVQRPRHVNHSAEEYVRAYFWHTNTVENYFSIFKRAVYGYHFDVSEWHLPRYAAEHDLSTTIATGLVSTIKPAQTLRCGVQSASD